MTYRVKNITIAVALALVAALLTSFYVTNYQRNVRKDETNVPVWVAARDIPAGTSGAGRSAEGHAREERGRPPQRRSGRDLQPRSGRRARRDAADLRGGAGLHPPLLDTVAARDQGPADRMQRAISSPATSTSCSPAPSRPATRSTSSPRSDWVDGRGRRRGRHPHRPPRHRGASRTRRSHRRRVEDLAGRRVGSP